MPKRYDRPLLARWTDLARVFTALGDEHRQRILLMFERGEELTIKSVADACPLSRTAISHHIRVLRDAGILVAQKRGKDMAKGNFTPKGKLGFKDARLMLDSAERLQVMLPMLGLYKQLMLKAHYEGWGDLDGTVVMKLYE